MGVLVEAAVVEVMDGAVDAGVVVGGMFVEEPVAKAVVVGDFVEPFEVKVMVVGEINCDVVVGTFVELAIVEGSVETAGVCVVDMGLVIEVPGEAEVVAELVVGVIIEVAVVEATVTGVVVGIALV